MIQFREIETICEMANILQITDRLDLRIKIKLNPEFQYQHNKLMLVMTCLMEEPNPMHPWMWNTINRLELQYELDHETTILVPETGLAERKVGDQLICEIQMLRKFIIERIDAYEYMRVFTEFDITFHHGACEITWYDTDNQSDGRRRIIVLFVHSYLPTNYVSDFKTAPLEQQFELIRVYYREKKWKEQAIAELFKCSVEFLANILQQYTAFTTEQIQLEEEIIDITPSPLMLIKGDE